MERSFDKHRGQQHLLAKPMGLSALFKGQWLKLMDPSKINLYQACLLLTALFIGAWLLETFVIGELFRLDPYTPFLVFWTLRARTRVTLGAILYTSIMLETAAARPIGLILIPYLSAYLLIMTIKDSLVMSSPKLWSLLILGTSSLVVLFEWTAFWLLSPMLEIQFLDVLALLLRIGSSLVFAFIFSRSMHWSALQSGELESTYA